VTRLHAELQAAATHHVTVVAASGDIGVVGEPCSIKGLTGAFTPVKGVSLPASDPLVPAAGGTSLNASHKTGAYLSETAWGLPYSDPGSTFQASGGGHGHLFARPGYQDGVPDIGATRGVPDVAADTSGHTGMALAISEGAGKTYIRNSGGTSATAPLWAGLIALANQYAGRRLGFVNPTLYRIAHTPLYHQAFHDITTGTNTVTFPPKTITGYQAAPGWDPTTGPGSPNAQVLIPCSPATPTPEPTGAVPASHRRPPGWCFSPPSNTSTRRARSLSPMDRRAGPWWVFVVAAYGAVGLGRWHGLAMAGWLIACGVRGRHVPCPRCLSRTLPTCWPRASASGPTCGRPRCTVIPRSMR
jgi:hypothetical protein